MNLPNAVEVEEYLLSAIMIDSQSIYQVVDIVQPEHFYKPEHRTIYASMLDLFSHKADIDVVSVYEKVKDKEIGTIFLSNLSGKASSSANSAYHARIVYEKFMLRELIKYGQRLTSIKDKDDPFDLAQEAESKIFDITQGAYKKSFVDLTTINNQTLKLLQQIKAKGENHFLVKTGFFDIDDLIGGFKRSDLIVLAGRPGMGKTSLALNIGKNVAETKPVGVNSLEMSQMQLSARLIAEESDIEVNRLLSGRFSEDDFLKIARATQKNNLPIYIDDSAGLDIFELKSKAKRLKAEQNIQLLIVDYLQLMKDRTKQYREQEVASISGHLKQIAKELDIPVLALSQMNRGVEGRTTKKPQLSDLRESGAIEQDADVVIFIHRPEVYDVVQSEDGTPTENLAQVIIAKNRNGAIGDVNLTFIKNKTKFVNYSRDFS